MHRFGADDSTGSSTGNESGSHKNFRAILAESPYHIQVNQAINQLCLQVKTDSREERVPMGRGKLELRANLLGRLLGHGELCIQDAALAASKNGKPLAVLPLGDCRGFATFTEGLLGGVLVLEADGRKARYRFLQRAGAEAFVDTLNAGIAAHVAAHVAGLAAEFQRHVVREYPRDSSIARLAASCRILASQYLSQSDLWGKHLAPACLEQVKALIRFHPVQAQVLREYHEKVQLERRAAFFDRVESNPLTHEQRLGVLRSNDRNLVLAAAGTGKTSVMVAKALDLIDRGLARPQEILVLAYNRTAAQELEERFKDKADRSGIVLDSAPQISTFHALGRKLLREAGVSTYLSVFTEDEIKLRQWVTSWLESYLAADGGRLVNFISLFPQPVNPFDFKTLADYERYVRDNEFRTLSGERVRGYQELLIANAMYLNGVNYAYEAPYVSKRRIDIGFDYRPDFHIRDTPIYIEHFGVDREGGTAPGIDAATYGESMQNKRQLHDECGTVLIETFHYEWAEGTLVAGLKERLAAQGIVFDPVPPEEILRKLREEGRIADWSELMKKALQAIRTERLDLAGIMHRLEKANVVQARALSELLNELHEAYVQELKRQNTIDFDDMIVRAIDVIEKGNFVPPWTYVLVDEFQDISEARMKFIQAIVEKGPRPSLTVVGDDWQSIYRFSGGKLELTTRFEKLIGAFSETKLQKTFRYNDSIANTAGQFIMENPEQYRKQIETHVKAARPQIHLLDDIDGSKDGVYRRLEEVVRKIRQNDASGSISVIARYNYLLQGAKEALTRAGLLAGMQLWTFHRSKGRETDYSILLGFFQGSNGFPNENKDDAIIEALLPSLDRYPHSEERRLLYVGLTRARKKVYVIASPTAPSTFITELLAPKYDIDIVSKTFREQYRQTFKCPGCADGYFRRIEGTHGPFYACGTGLGCTTGRARVCTACAAPSIDGRSASLCNNAACGSTTKICERCGRPMKLREGKFGRFWGCTGYGIKDDQCKHTVKLGKTSAIDLEKTAASLSA